MSKDLKQYLKKLEQQEKELFDDYEKTNDIDMDIEKEFSLEGLITFKYFKKIIFLLKKKVILELVHLPKVDTKLDNIIDLLETKVELEEDIIDRLDTKIELEEDIIERLDTKIELEEDIVDRLDTIIEQLEVKIGLETEQPEVDCECAVVGIGTGQVVQGQDTGTLNISVCEDCTIDNSFFMITILNPEGMPLRRINSVTFETEECDLTDGDGTVTITGTAEVRVGQGTTRLQDFTLVLDVEDFNVTSFTITTDNVTREVENIPPGDIVVEEICNSL
ncbi:hypothetical protein [Halothermothrix orenii]|uniref:Uncharacterized protein n=1 Tax=Halothermothrix orenii (strain H 168 / OCM 544 / DSM 9562) TaxID=373903 RepID=B8CX77_HALOH|nr:hypothetical protein [Halothermothrix orenii]ACL69896.1 hypothetical protein Hore_11440 [Halothermothrix orenii H 168]